VAVRLELEFGQGQALSLRKSGDVIHPQIVSTHRICALLVDDNIHEEHEKICLRLSSRKGVGNEAFFNLQTLYFGRPYFLHKF
jgi:hypothetical protein